MQSRYPTERSRTTLFDPTSTHSTDTDADAGDAPKSYENILAQQIESAMDEFERSSGGLFLSALSAGLDLGFGPLLIAAMLTLVGGVYSEPLTEILAANAYTVGFVFVVLGRTSCSPNTRRSPCCQYSIGSRRSRISGGCGASSSWETPSAVRSSPS